MINRYVTVAFSAEMIGMDGLHLLDLHNLQEANGSVAYSPAATAFVIRYVQPDNPTAIEYCARSPSMGQSPIQPQLTFSSWAGRCGTWP